MNKRYHSIIVALTFLTGCCSAPEKERSDQQSMAVAAQFKQLKDAGELKGIAPNDHGELSIFPVTPQHRQEEWFQHLSPRAKQCKDLYFGEVDLSTGKKMRYFFCADTRIPTLVGNYSLDGTGWKTLP